MSTLRKTRSTRSTAAVEAEELAAAVAASAAPSTGGRKRKASVLKAAEATSELAPAVAAAAPATTDAPVPTAAAAVAATPAPAAAAALSTPAKTTSATAASGSATRRSVAPMTPNRAARLEEKQELQDLNKRLELYILKMREREGADATSGAHDMDELRVRTRQEVEHVRVLCTEQLTELRKQRDASASRVAALEEQLKRANDELKARSTVLSNNQSYTADLDKRAAALVSDLAAARAKVQTLELAVKAAEAQAEADANRIKLLEVEVKKQRERADAATATMTAAQNKARAATEDLALLQTKHQRETSALAVQVSALTSQHVSVEDALRREFTAQLEQLLEERMRQFDAEKQAGLQELRTVYDAKLASYRTSLEQVGQEIEGDRGKVDAMAVKLAHAQAAANEAVATKDALQKRVAELTASLEAAQKRHTAELSDKSAALTKIKAIFRRKDEEFDELMGVKIALAMEIKAYRQLLDREEERLGYAFGGTGADGNAFATPVRAKANGAAATPASASASAASASKRATSTITTVAAAAAVVSRSSSTSTAAAGAGAGAADGSVGGAAKKRRVGADRTEKLSIERVDLDRQYVVVRNSTTDSLALGGWVLRARDGTKTDFKFAPALTLAPGNTVTVWAGAAFKAKEKAPSDAVWAVDNVWHAQGDAALLVSPAGEVVSRVEVMPKH